MKAKRFLLAMFALLTCFQAWSEDGYSFTETINGVDWKFEIISETDRTCMLGVNPRFEVAVSDNISGNVTIPSNVQGYKVVEIRDDAFYDCQNITSITIPSSVTSIGSTAFNKCSGLTSITVNAGNSIYDSRGGCNAIIRTASNTLIAGCSETTIPNSVTSIGHFAFYGHTGLISIVIPYSVTSIGSYAFYGCSGLTSVTVESETPRNIDNWTFSNRTNATLYVPYGCRAAYEAANYWKEFKEIIEMPAPAPTSAIAFAHSGVKTLCVNNWDTNGDGELSIEEAAAVTNLGEVFKSDRSITSFDELQHFTGLTNIGNHAFDGCDGLTSITIPTSVTSIGKWAFHGCSGLTSITIPNSVTTLESYAFAGCSRLTSITIPNALTSIDNYVFVRCSGLKSIIVDENNPTYDSRNGCNAIIRSASNTLIAGCSKTTIPNSVTSIGDAAFSGCTGLTSITIPNAVTSIGDAAFMNCTGLTSITIPNSVTSIGDSAFYRCI